MAEAVLFDVAGKVLEELGSLALREISLAKNAKDELAKLGRTVSIIKAVLLDAEEKHNSNNRAVTLWLRQLKDAVYDVDDLLDDFSTEVLRRRRMKGNKMSKKVRIFFSKSNQISYRLRVGHRVKALRQKLDEIADARIKFQLSDRLAEQSQIQNRESNSSLPSKEVIGRDGDKSKIIEMLLETNPKESITVVPIVGIGGLGKTTLAQMVFNDEKIRARFEPKMWVCVSDRFEVKLVVEKILEAATQETVQPNSQLETLQNKLREKIDGKKYFLVLDDVWNEDEEKWSMLKNLLMGGATGSRIVVTTRSQKVGIVTGRISSPYFLKGLSESQSWSLFKQIAFEKQIQTINFLDLELETIGKEIVKCCGGVPLAIRAVGSVLSFKTTKREWSRVLENITQQGTGIEPILRLSYDHLPSPLKQCFAYCYLFPKDYRMRKHALINLWMAQGFIQPPNRGQSLEDVGHDYFMDLLWGSFFQEVEEDDFGNIESCKMHDLMHDLARSVAGTECFVLTNVDVENLDENTRHVSLSEELDFYSWKILGVFLQKNKIRTFLQPNIGCLSESNCETIIRSCRHLRMLDLKGPRSKKLPHSICRLKHLRYLDLSGYSDIRKLPNSVTRLQNLQTLDLNECWDLRELPRDIGNMVSLRHLEIDYCFGLRGMPCGLGQLTCLRTLPLFVVGERDGHFGGLSELNRLNDLRGQLYIDNLGNAAPEIGDAYLKDKLYLDSLTLRWFDDSVAGLDAETVLESLEPHPNLKKLIVIGFNGAKFSNWLSSITNLVRIEIMGCEKCRYLPPMDHLPSLKHIQLCSLDALEYVSETNTLTATTFFPSLEYVRIFSCPNLMGWWRRRKEDDEESTEEPCFPCLSTLIIKECPNLTSFPLFPTLNDKLTLRGTSGKPLQQTILRMRTKEMITSSAATASSVTLPLSNLKSLSLKLIENVGDSMLKELLQNCRCTCLESLHIEHCLELTSLPTEQPALTSLQKLTISHCDNLMALPDWISNLTCLQELVIQGCPKLTLLPSGMGQLTNLQKLGIDVFHNLMSLPDWISNFTCLQELVIQGCPKLTLLPNWMSPLINLQKLRIINCPDLMALPDWISNLTCLQKLVIQDCPKSALLPNWTSPFTNLQKLIIINCPDLMALPDWISNLTCLWKLKIEDCPKLTLLSNGMSRLTNLFVVIRNCPGLSNESTRSAFSKSTFVDIF